MWKQCPKCGCDLKLKTPTTLDYVMDAFVSIRDKSDQIAKGSYSCVTSSLKNEINGLWSIMRDMEKKLTEWKYLDPDGGMENTPAYDIVMRGYYVAG